jgi:hypothetical protein
MMNRFRGLDPIWRYAIPCLIAMIALGGMLVGDLSAYERKVLFEDYTNSG